MEYYDGFIIVFIDVPHDTELLRLDLILQDPEMLLPIFKLMIETINAFNSAKLYCHGFGNIYNWFFDVSKFRVYFIAP